MQSEQGASTATAGEDQLAALRTEMDDLSSKLQASQSTVSRLVAATPSVTAAPLEPRGKKATAAAKKAAAAATAAAATAAAAAAKPAGEAAKALAK